MRKPPAIIVFAGPPCSGKSTLARAFASRSGTQLLGMDDTRVRLIPGSDQRKEHRDISYRAIHWAAEGLLSKGCDVILDATYFPKNHREEVENITACTRTSLFVIECEVSPDEATRRFVARGEGHAAVDLTEERVRHLAAMYPYCRQGLVIKSDSTPLKESLGAIESYLESGVPLEFGVWTASCVTSPPTVLPLATSPDISGNKREKLSDTSRRSAKWRLWRFGVLIPVSIACGAISVLMLLGGIALTLTRDHSFTIWRWSVAHTDLLQAAEVWVGLAVVAGGIIPLIDFVSRTRATDQPIRDAGLVARYAPTSDLRRSDREVYDMYLSRVLPQGREGFLLDGVPIYFIVPPRNGKGFDVKLKTWGTPLNADPVASDSADIGFDWQGFRRFRIEDKRGEYYTWINEYGIRCTKLEQSSATDQDVTLWVHECTWNDYLTRELAVDTIGSQGILPDIRALCEGEPWQSQSINLSDVPEAAKRYSMLISVSVLVTTSDGYFVLHRRSKHVSQGAGGISATASGFAHWEKDLLGRQRRVRKYLMLTPETSSLTAAALRELNEETAISPGDLRLDSRPFIGGAFNLLHGRDLNFYSHLRARVDRARVSELRGQARDAWEIANLVFLPISSIRYDEESRELRTDDTFRELSTGFNRHLRGLLCALAVTGQLEDLQREFS